MSGNVWDRSHVKNSEVKDQVIMLSFSGIISAGDERLFKTGSHEKAVFYNAMKERMPCVLSFFCAISECHRWKLASIRMAERTVIE